MLVWLTLPFYDFCGFRSVAVNSVYKLQFFYIYFAVSASNISVSKRAKALAHGWHTISERSVVTSRT